MQAVKFHIVAVTLFVLLFETNCFVLKSKSGNIVTAPKAMFFLGTINGKLYFSEKSVPRTWQEAKKACEDSGFEIATVQNEAEADFLRRIDDQSNFYGGWWMGARDVMTPRQFVWDKTNTPLDENVINGISFGYGMQTCLYYEGIYHNYYEAKPCSITAQALCEFKGAVA